MHYARSRDRCHAHGHTLLRNAAVSRPGSPFEKSKNQSAPIGLKFGTGMFSTTPETMAMFILRENDVITQPHPFTRRCEHLQVGVKIPK